MKYKMNWMVRMVRLKNLIEKLRGVIALSFSITEEAKFYNSKYCALFQMNSNK